MRDEEIDPMVRNISIGDEEVIAHSFPDPSCLFSADDDDDDDFNDRMPLHLNTPFSPSITSLQTPISVYPKHSHNRVPPTFPALARKPWNSHTFYHDYSAYRRTSTRTSSMTATAFCAFVVDTQDSSHGATNMAVTNGTPPSPSHVWSPLTRARRMGLAQGTFFGRGAYAISYIHVGYKRSTPNLRYLWIRVALSKCTSDGNPRLPGR